MRFARIMAVVAMLGVAAPAIASDRGDARAAMNRGLARFYEGNPRAARIELLNAVQAQPGWALPHAVQARIYLAIGDGVAAEAELQRATAAGMPAADLMHLAAHAYLLQGQAQRALDVGAKAPANPLSQAYAARIRALAAIALGNFGLAANELDRAAAITPDSSLLWSDIGRFRMLTGNIGGAVEAAQRASQLSPVNVEALLLMGQLMRGQYGLIASLPWYERALEIDPGNLAAMGEAAATLGDAGRTNDMLEMTRRMLSVDPGNAQAYYLQAVLAARAGNADLARSLIYRIGGRMDSVPGMMLLQGVIELKDGNAQQAIAKLENLVEAQPSNIKARRLLGAAQWRAGDARAAISVLDRMARRADADSYTLSVIGRAYEADGNRDAAAFFLDRASAPVRGEPLPFEMQGNLAALAAANTGDPNSADVAIPRISRMIASGQTGEALAAAEKLRNQNRGAPAAHVLVGDALIAMGRSVAAANAYRDAANIQFSEPTAMRFIAALQRSGQGAAALRVLDLFLSQNPRSVPALLLASDHFMATAQWDRAIDILEALRIRLGNRDATILANLAWAWFSKDYEDKAAEYAAAAYRLSPANAAVANSYGWILYETGKDQTGGIALLRKAVGIAPDHPGLRFQLAQALASTGQKSEAKTQLQTVLAGPNFPDRKKAAALFAGL